MAITNREKTKELIREKIFAIHEAYETNNWDNLRAIEHSIKWNLMRTKYKGHKKHLKDFVYEYMGYKYKISYEWTFTYEKIYRRKKQTSIYGPKMSRWVTDTSKDPIKSKMTVIDKVYIKRLQ